MVESSDLVRVLGAFSNEISLKILNAYSKNKNGLNLTETSKIIQEKTTTVKDHLTKLLDSNLIYVKGKTYYLSYFGALILKMVDRIEILNRAKSLFGQVSSDLIPTQYIFKLLPHLKNVKVFNSNWAFINVGNKIIDFIQNDKSKNKNYELKLIGWNSVTTALEIARSSFKNVAVDLNNIKDFIIDVNLKMITDKSFLNDLDKNEILKNLHNIPEIQERVLIYDGFEEFNFMLIRYNKYITFFLNESQDENLGPYFILTDSPRIKPSAIDIYEEIFEYFANKSTPMTEVFKEL